MKRLLPYIFLVSLFTVTAFPDSVTVMGGYFLPQGDSDIFLQNERETTFETSDLNDFAVSVRYDHFLGDFVSIGAGLSAYESDTNVEDVLSRGGQPIIRNIRLQIVPLEFHVHFLPAGRNAAIIPYVGGGIGAYFWEYEEAGDFVFDRLTNPHIMTGSAFSDGADAGYHVEGGIQIPVSRSATITAEAKYFNAEGDLDVRGFDPSFQPIDLSGTLISGGVSIWF